MTPAELHIAANETPVASAPSSSISSERGRLLRIAFLATEYHLPGRLGGGLASYLRRASRALVALGHDVEVFTLSPEEICLNDESVRVECVSGRNRIQRVTSRLPWFWRYAELASLVGPAWNLYRAFMRRHRERPFDVIQATNSQACGLVAAIRKPVPVVTRLSTYEPLCRDAYEKPLDAMQRARERAELWQMRWSTRTYAPSHLLADALMQDAKVPIDVVEPPFAVDLPDAVASLPHPCLRREQYGLFFGAIGVLKGCARLTSVLPGLLERNPDLRFVFAGAVKQTIDGTPFDRYIEEKLGLFGDRVLVLPPLPHEELFPLLAGARFVVLPSRFDNLPNACLEAMALARVVIGTHGASFDQVIDDGDNGFLASQDDDGQLADCLEAAWRMPEPARRQLGRKAVQTIARMQPDRAAARLAEYYRQAIARRRNRKPTECTPK